MTEQHQSNEPPKKPYEAPRLIPVEVDPVKEMLVDCRSTGKNFRQCAAVSS
jgi:hypothetical protein